MEFRIRDMSYGLLLSHTLPGLLFGLEILLAFELFTKPRIIDFLHTVENNVASLITALIVVFVPATLLGFILDGIHHWLFEDVIWEKIKKTDLYNAEFYRVIKTNQQMQIYKQLLEDFWYPYEAYANIGIAMLPGIILLPYWLCSLGVRAWFIVILTIVYIFILYVMGYEAYCTLEFYQKAEKQLTENFGKDHTVNKGINQCDRFDSE